MTTENIETLLEHWKKCLLVNAGAGAALLAATAADIPNLPGISFPGWFGVWFVLQLASLTPAAILLISRVYRKLPFAERMNTVFGYTAVAWIELFAFGLKVTFSTGPWPVFWNLISIAGLGLGILFFILRRKYVNAPEAMFP
jgi:hypothetical protein